MYSYSIGLLDKDTKKQEVTTTKALDIISDIIAANTQGATIYNATGIYTHENGEQVKEPSIKIETTEETPRLINALKELKAILNQESIFRVVTQTTEDFI